MVDSEKLRLSPILPCRQSSEKKSSRNGSINSDNCFMAWPVMIPENPSNEYPISIPRIGNFVLFPD